MSTPRPDAHSIPPSRHRPSHPWRWAGVVLVAGLAITGVLARWIWLDAARQDALRFATLTRASWELIETRVEKYELALLGLAEWFSTSETPSLGQWGARMERFDLAVNYPGMIEAGYIVHLPGNIEGRWAKCIPSHWHLEDAYPRGGIQDIIAYVDRPETGLEMVEAARGFPIEDGQAAGRSYRVGIASGPATIVATNAGAQLPGFRLYAAAYHQEQYVRLEEVLSKQPDAQQMRMLNRGNALIGWAYGAVATERLLSSVLGPGPREVDFDWFGGAPSSSNRLNHTDRPAYALTPAYAQGLHTNLVVPWYGEKWTLAYYPTPSFYAHSERGRTWLVVGGGLALSWAIACLAFLHVRARSNAEALALELAESRELLKIAAEDRARLSRELHDGTIQTLYATGLILGRLRKEPGDRDSVAAGLAQATAQLDSTVGDLRRYLVAHGRSESGPTRSLQQALDELVRGWRASHTAEFRLQAEAAAGDGLPAHAVAELLQIAREAVSNSLRHGRARNITLWLRNIEGQLRLEVADDGSGFDPRAIPRHEGGLANMRQRAADLGGTLRLESQPGGPTTVIVEVPAR
jgi:signal transduction histidine kinase